MYIPGYDTWYPVLLYTTLAHYYKTFITASGRVGIVSKGFQIVEFLSNGNYEIMTMGQ